MKKAATFITAVAIVAMVGSVAMAQSAYWLDTRNDGNQPGTGAASVGQDISAPLFPYTNGQDTPGAFNAGGPGDGQVLRISPTTGTNFETSIPTSYPNFDVDGDTSTGDLYLYVDMANDPQDDGDVLSSVGIDFDVTGGAVAGGLGSLSYEWIDDQSAFGDPSVVGGAGPWDGTDNGAEVAGNPPSHAGAKAVQVPVDAGPMYNSASGLEPGGSYRLGRLRAQGAFRDCTFALGHAAARFYDVTMRTNNLLITRAFDPALPNPAIYATEQVQFGYTAGVLDAAVDGGLANQSSANPDAQIQVRFKGDVSGDGRTLNNDIAGFTAARTATTAGNSHTQLQAWLFDVSGDRRVLNNDIGGFTAARDDSTINQAASCTP